MLEHPIYFCTVILTAVFMDLVIGDPRSIPHPIVWMGRAITFSEPGFRRIFKNQLLAGMVFAFFLIGAAWLLSAALINLFSYIHPLAGLALETVLLFFCLSAGSLEKAALQVDDALLSRGVAGGRGKVSMIVGRDVKHLDESGVIRATVETVAENFVDGFLSPLFFAVIGGVPLAVAYKMVNTLDSMVGYKNDRYILFGRAGARIDDIANYVPARLSVLFISMAAALLPQGARGFKRAGEALTSGISEGHLHKSPNAGFPEAAFAGALAVRLGGGSYYHGTFVDKPLLGSRFPEPGRKSIQMACDLMLLSSFVSILAALMVSIPVRFIIFAS
ncbi:MAG: cobalamin biosynthesis protein CobD [Desulfamplus sp.]|nr:cobalamin biosynthesis protein CobD [Desulfamplus sp.]